MKILRRLVASAVLLLALCIYLFPVFWLILTSIKQPIDQLAIPPVWLSKPPTAINYVNFFSKSDVSRAFLNSFFIALCTAVLTTLVGSLAAYAIVRLRTGGVAVPLAFLATRVIPPTTPLIPVYLLATYLRLTDTQFLLVVMYSALNVGLAIWTLRSFFVYVPFEVEEACMVDGCTRLRAIWHGVLPLALPGLLATALLVFILSWNEFIFALVLTGRFAKTLPVLLSGFVTRRGLDWGVMAAGGVLMILPTVALATVFQRHLLRAYTGMMTR